jgi:hypothetical protein
MSEAARAEAFAAQADRSREMSAGYIQQAIAVARQVADIRDNVARSLSSASIAHRWVGTRLEILSPDGTWAEGPDLQGIAGSGITSAVIDEEYHLILTIEGVGDVDAGYLRGAPGNDGVDGTDGISVTAAQIDSNGHLVLSFSTGSPVDVGQVVGQDGTDGADGSDGDDGLAATVSIGSVATLPAGSSATVENVGTPNAAVLNIGLPKGDKGDSSGTVTSIGVAMPTGFQVTNSPVTTAGTITVAFSAGYAPFTTGEQVKLGHISVTQPVDLDAIESRIIALDAVVILKGTWSAASGTFPGGGTAQAGESWIVSTDGTVNGVAFAAGDRLIAVTDNASTTAFAGNWFKADYTDQVLSVDGAVGAVTVGAIIAASTSKATPVDADKLAISDSAASNGSKHVTFANLKTWIWTALGGLINGGTAKTTPVDADMFALADSAASNATKKVTWANIKATLNSLYVRLGTDGALTAGFTATAVNDGTKSSGTYTPTPAGGNFKRAVNGGAHTLAAPDASGDYTMIIQYTNSGTAGAVTLSGFSKTSGIFTTTSGDDFMVYISKVNGFTHANIVALQ